jgi:AraC-like DNA-binding protein
VLVARNAEQFRTMFRAQVIDAAIVDLGAAPDPSLDRVVSLASDFPSAAFIGLSPYRAADGPLIARCAERGFADVLADGVDDGTLRDVVARRSFSRRFGASLREPPASMALDSRLQRAAWHALLEGAGRSVSSSELASRLGVSREHLSRSFGAGKAPSLKRAMDLVRVLAAAALSKNPGYDASDVAHILGFASVAQLSKVSERTAGVSAASLARLRTVDLLNRFVRASSNERP